MTTIEKKLNHAVCMVNKIILPFNPSPDLCSFLRKTKSEYGIGEVKWTCEFINFCIDHIETSKDILPSKLVVCGPGDEYENKENEIIVELASEYATNSELYSGSKIITEKNKIKVESGYRIIVLFDQA